MQGHWLDASYKHRKHTHIYIHTGWLGYCVPGARRDVGNPNERTTRTHTDTQTQTHIRTHTHLIQERCVVAVLVVDEAVEDAHEGVVYVWSVGPVALQQVRARRDHARVSQLQLVPEAGGVRVRVCV